MSRKRSGRGKGNTRTLVAIYSCICYLFDFKTILSLFFKSERGFYSFILRYLAIYSRFICYLFELYDKNAQIGLIFVSTINEVGAKYSVQTSTFVETRNWRIQLLF